VRYGGGVERPTRATTRDRIHVHTTAAQEERKEKEKRKSNQKILIKLST